jgi:hypothetical protein
MAGRAPEHMVPEVARNSLKRCQLAQRVVLIPIICDACPVDELWGVRHGDKNGASQPFGWTAEGCLVTWRHPATIDAVSAAAIGATASSSM